MDANATAAGPLPLDNSNQQTAIITAWVVVTVLATVTVGLRFYTRRIILHIWGPEDWLIFISMVCNLQLFQRQSVANLVLLQVLSIGTCIGFVRRA